MIPTFSLTLTVCCELLVLCQSLQPTTSEQTVLYHQDNGKTLRLGSDEHSLEKPVKYDAVVQLFAERYPRRMLLVDPVFDETQN